MNDDKTISTPTTPEQSGGSAMETFGANTNLDPNMQGGPTTPADQAATREVVQEKTRQGVPGSQGTNK